MTDEKQEGQKTIVSFIVGLLIGGLLVWAFSGPAVDAPKETKMDQESEEGSNDEKMTEEKADEEAAPATETPAAPKLEVGEGKVEVENQAAGSSVTLKGATYPVAEGWIGVRDYQNDQLGTLLGVARFSAEQGLVPTSVVLQRPTQAGREYAVVVYTESGDRQFSLANDTQVGSVFATFTAQ